MPKTSPEEERGWFPVDCASATFIPPIEYSAGGMASNDDLLHAWLSWLGLHFDPFLPLDAAADPRLSDYLVGHDVFAATWGNWLSFVFAPAGGGKTALRVRTAQACWVGQETNRPFPIPYVPPFLVWGHVLPSLDDHLAALARAGAIQLLLALAYRPHWLLRLDDAARRSVRDVLAWNLPGPLPRYLFELRQSLSPAPLRDIFDPTFALADPPDTSTLLHFCDILEQSPLNEIAPPPPAARWHALCELLLELLKFHSIYVLIDGLDAAPETSADAQMAVSSLSALLPMLLDWSLQRIFAKGFLPVETQPILQSQFPAICAGAHVATMDWTPVLLAEVIRRRVYVASEGAFGSVDAISSPALRDVETILARSVIPLPREMLVLTRRVLVEHVHHDGHTGKIEEKDVETAIRWYIDNRPEAKAKGVSQAS